MANPQPTPSGTVHRAVRRLRSDLFRPVTNCWVCGSRHLRQWFAEPLRTAAHAQHHPEMAPYDGCRVWLMTCSRCGFSQPQVLPRLATFFDHLYDQRWTPEWIATEFEAAYKDVIFTEVLDTLERRLSCRAPAATSPPWRLLDVGCHVGRFVHLARQAGWQPEGIELNPLTSAFAATQTGLAIHRCDARTLARRGHTYQAVTLLDVLEHIPQPLDILRAVAEVLEPGGVVAVKVPCGPAQLFKERTRKLLDARYTIKLASGLVHINHFTAGSLALALRRAGFDEITVTVGAPETSGLAVPSRNDRFRLAVHRLARAIPRGVDTPLALNLQAYARRV